MLAKRNEIIQVLHTYCIRISPCNLWCLKGNLTPFLSPLRKLHKSHKMVLPHLVLPLYTNLSFSHFQLLSSQQARCLSDSPSLTFFCIRCHRPHTHRQGGTYSSFISIYLMDQMPRPSLALRPPSA